MSGRFVIFLILMFVILIGHQLLMMQLYPPEPKPAVEEIEPGAEPAAEQGAQPDEAQPADQDENQPAPPGDETQPDEETPTPGGEEAQPAEEDQAVEPAVEPAAPAAPTKWITIGSLDPEDPYRMLITFNSRGGSIHRVELNSSRYRKLDTRTGYMGNLLVDEVAAAFDMTLPGMEGCPVQVCGKGTPAYIAGIRQGDRITKIDGTPIAQPSDLKYLLQKTRPNREIDVEYLPAGSTEKKIAKVMLAWTPLQLIRPAEYGISENYDPHPSMLLTLKQIGQTQLKRPEELVEVGRELPGLDLWSSNWEVEEDAANALVRFLYKVPADPENGIPAGLTIVKSFQLDRLRKEEIANTDYPAYSMNMDIEIRAEGEAKQQIAYQLDGFSGMVAEGAWYANKVSRNWSAAGLRDVLVSYEYDVPEMFTTAKIADNKIPTPDKDRQLTFVALDAQYFSGAVIPSRPQNDESLWFERTHALRIGKKPKDVRETNTSFRMISQPTAIDSTKPLKHSFRVFLGPKVPSLLASYKGGLDQLVYYGWFGWVAKPMTAILHFFYYIIGNFGIAILLLTVVVRSAMFPLSKKQVISAQKMQELQPELKRLQERYKKDMQARSRAQQELFRKHGVNPMGGCLPVFIQLPIFLGLYRALMVDIELRQAPLISQSIQWCSNLAAPDMLFRWTGFMPGLITGPLGPFFNILPILTVILFIVQQKMLMPPAADDQQAMQQKIMKFMMIFIGFLFYKVASGLCIYFIASSVWGVCERKWMPKPAKKDAVEGAGAAPDARTRAQARAEAREQLERERSAADARRDKKRASDSQERGKRRKKRRQ